MTFEDMLDFNLSATEGFTSSRAVFVHQLFLKLEKVPDTDGLVQTARGNERVLRVEGCTHDVVRVAGKDCNFAAVLPVPNTHGLVVAGRNNPRQVVVELDSAHVIDMAVEGEHALLGLVAPYFDEMVITTRDEHRLGFMEMDASNRT